MTEEVKKKKKAPVKKAAAETEAVKLEKKAVKHRIPKEKAEAVKPAADEIVDENSKLAYLYAVGRRKSSVAQVRLIRKGNGKMTVNSKDYMAYFPRFDLQEALRAPLKSVGQLETMDVWAKVKGGGIRGQAEAIRLGIARALVLQNPTFRVSLKRLDYLRRDPREKERKKYGLKKARRAPQWAKR